MKRLMGFGLAIAALLLMALSLTVGPSNIKLVDTLAIVAGKSSSASQSYIIWQLRLPRILASFFCGAILSLSGAVFQASLRNPMADPFILGISSGASFGVAVAVFFGFAPLFGLPGSALVGAIGTTLGIIMLAARRRSSSTTLLLTGVAFNYILSAAMTLLMFLHKEQYQRILFWTLGSFSSSTYVQVFVIFIAWSILFITLSLNSSSMDMLLLDELSARSGGLSVKRTRVSLLLLASFATALCVAYFGVIGFIGLMAPHATRLLVGPKHKSLLLPSSLLGGVLLLSSDTLSRILLPSGELPVGVITSLLGVPVFIHLLRRGKYFYG